MAFDRETRKRKILQLLRDNGGSCSYQEWRDFEVANKTKGPWDIDLTQVWIPSKLIDDDEVNERYMLTDLGRNQCKLLERKNEGNSK